MYCVSFSPPGVARSSMPPQVKGPNSSCTDACAHALGDPFAALLSEVYSEGLATCAISMQAALTSNEMGVRCRKTSSVLNSSLLQLRQHILVGFETPKKTHCSLKICETKAKQAELKANLAREYRLLRTPLCCMTAPLGRPVLPDVKMM